MKQLWLAILIMVGMTALLAWNGAHLRGEIHPLQQELDRAVLAAKEEDWPQAEHLTREIYAKWKGQVQKLYLFQSHREVDEITILFEESLEYAVSQNTAEWVE